MPRFLSRIWAGAFAAALLLSFSVPCRAQGYWQAIKVNGDPADYIQDGVDAFWTDSVNSGQLTRSVDEWLVQNQDIAGLVGYWILPNPDDTPDTDSWAWGAPGTSKMSSLTAGIFNYGNSPAMNYVTDSGGGRHFFGGTVSGSASVNKTLTFRWEGTGAAPNYVDVLLITDVDALARADTGTNATANVSNSLGDTARAASAGTVSQESHWKRRLLRVPASNGRATFTYTGAFSVLVNSPPSTERFAVANARLVTDGWYRVESRHLQITSDIDPTYHREGPDGAGERVQNVRPVGSENIDGDTVKPPPTDEPDTYNIAYITYNASFGSGWSFASTYFLNSNWTGRTDEGLINSLGAGQIIVPYRSDTFTVGIIATDHVHLSGTDPSDGVVATDNYHMRLHDKYEEPFFNDGYRQERHPYPFDPANLDTWVPIADLDNPGDEDTHETLGHEIEFKHTEDGSIEGDVTGLAKGMLEAKFGIKIGEEKKETLKEEYALTAYAGVETIWFAAQEWSHSYGTIARYAQSGFDKDADWEVIAVGAVSTHGERYPRH